MQEKKTKAGAVLLNITGPKAAHVKQPVTNSELSLPELHNPCCRTSSFPGVAALKSSMFSLCSKLLCYFSWLYRFTGDNTKKINHYTSH